MVHSCCHFWCIPNCHFWCIFNYRLHFSQMFEFKPYCVLLNSKNKSYNLLNATKTLNEIDDFNNEIIDELDSIVLFDCERKSLMSNFSLEEINKWNSDYDTSFKKYLIITFGKEYQSINVSVCPSTYFIIS